MKLRRQMLGVLGNFLTAFTSRYADYDGYWLPGLLMREGAEFEFDLLRPESGQTSPVIRFAARTAVEIFRKQVRLSVVPLACFSHARLRIENTGRSIIGPVNHRPTMGYEVSFAATARSDLGKDYAKPIVVFVAPHDPDIEHRSTRRLDSPERLGSE